jgi:DNA mismatch endonuclease (patch repair protein)
MDNLTPAQRSERMGRVKSKDTKPEMWVRRLVHGMGYRYRLQVSALPGKPDLVFPKYRKVIFVHGCFWHRHPDRNCKLARLPKSGKGFWLNKLQSNYNRDLVKQQELRKLGWGILVIWECELRNQKLVESKIGAFLQNEID